MQRKKLLFLINTLKFGGAEKQTIDLINRLDTSRFAISICYFLQEEDLKEEIKEDRLEGIYCLHKMHRFDINALKRLKLIVRDLKPDAVLCVTSYSAVYAHLLRFLSRIKFKIINVLHSTVMSSRYKDLQVRFLYRLLANNSDAVVFVCRNQMDYWINKYGIKKNISRFIYNGIDVKHFNFNTDESEKKLLIKKLNIRESDTVICICANLGAPKRHVDLIMAGRILLDMGLSIKILIVGDGAERAAIEKQVALLGMGDQVVITGHQRDVRPYLGLTDIYVMCSLTETFSIAVLEAMAMGKALVVPNMSGLAEQVVHGENGLLFPVGNVKALAESLAKIIQQDSSKAMGERSREMVQKLFTSELMVEQYENLLESI